MALAMAVRAACLTVDCDRPKVALAAYGCPDLVAAILFAGAEPLYVDLESDRFNMKPSALMHTIQTDPDVCAVIGVDLFGIAENWQTIRDGCTVHPPLFIQDCAQSLQSKSAIGDDLHGDVAVFSFGRGKPVCRLGGGALLASENLPSELLDWLDDTTKNLSTHRGSASTVKLFGYNALINPRVYPILAMIMGRRLGETRFSALESASRLSRNDILQIDAAVELHWTHHNDQCAALVSALSPLLQQYPNEIRIPGSTRDSKFADRTYLRCPLLVRSRCVRDELIDDLLAVGISATAMYKRILPDIIASQGRSSESDSFPVARDVASRLITLPVHERITDDEVRVMAEVIRNRLKLTKLRSRHS